MGEKGPIDAEPQSAGNIVSFPGEQMERVMMVSRKLANFLVAEIEAYLKSQDYQKDLDQEIFETARQKDKNVVLAIQSLYIEEIIDSLSGTSYDLKSRLMDIIDKNIVFMHSKGGETKEQKFDAGEINAAMLIYKAAGK